jgi:hypothetical protein
VLSDFARTCPILINTRDRVADLINLVIWLEEAGYENIVLVDNASTYPPLLDYLERSPYDVMHLGDNYGSRSIWRSGRLPETEFVYTDPDLMPIEACPEDIVDRLKDVLYSTQRSKVAAGLYLEDTPEFQSLQWERDLVTPRAGGPCQGEFKAERRTVDGAVVKFTYFDTLSDTSFALYRPHTSYTLQSLRLGYPYQMRHLPWYHLDNPTAEETYYLEHAVRGPLGSSWAEGKQ